MKALKSIILGSAAMLALSLTSCEDWLDVNVDPENPSSQSTTYDARLAHIQFFVEASQGIADWRTSMGMGDWTRYYGGGTYWANSYWAPAVGMVTTAYQQWFCGAGANIQDMYDKAVAAEAWHYAGLADLMHAIGFMQMTDLHGEMPYTDALGANAMPVFDTGRTIYLGCLERLDRAIEYLQMPQDPQLPSLAVGDYWNGGDVNKWLKFAHLLKARWCNKLIKKAPGSYLEGKFDEATILESLSKAMTSNADNTVIEHEDNANSSGDPILGRPVDLSTFFWYCGTESGYMVTKMLYDNLTNFAGCGIEDPRADKIIPWAWSQKTANSPAEVKFVGNWRRSMGVDMVTNASPNMTGGPLRASFDADKGWWIDSKAEARLGDTIYVECTSRSKGYHANPDLYYRRLTGNDASRVSGSYYSRVTSPTYMGSYAEVCFIKAEILFNKGDKSGAFTAYKEGIKASMEAMNTGLEEWADVEELKTCPSFTLMAQADIDNYLANGIGTAADLTLGKILTQKRIALHFSMEIWNDMRRYDFNPELFLGWGIPAYHAVDAAAQQAIPNGKYYRRWQHCRHEFDFNAENLHAIGAEVPGADMSSEQWNTQPDVWTIPVWWDSDQQ